MTFKDTSHALKLCFGALVEAVTGICTFIGLLRSSCFVTAEQFSSCHTQDIFRISHVGLLGDYEPLAYQNPCSSTTRLPSNTPLFTVRLGLLVLFVFLPLIPTLDT